MLTLKWLKFSGIGRFVEEQLLDFTTLASLVQIDGLNKNTGGSSGAGKSTIFNALDYLLGLNAIPNGLLQSRLTTSGIYVEGEFDWDGKALNITRAKKGLTVRVEGTAITGSKLAEEKLDEILAIPRDLFRQILHKRQDDRGFFLKLTPGQIHEFLTDALGLEAYREKMKTLDVQIKAESSELLAAQNQLKIHEASLEATRNARDSMGVMPVTTLTAEAVQAQLDLTKNLAQMLGEITHRHLAEKGAHDAKRPQVAMVPFDRTRAQTIQEGIKLVSERARALSDKELARQAAISTELHAHKMTKMVLVNAVNYGVKARSDAQSVASEIKLIRDAICPTCTQSWTTESAKRKEAELLAKLKSFKATVDLGLESEKKRDEIIILIADLEQRLRPMAIEGLPELMREKEHLTAALTAEIEAERAHQSAELLKSSTVINEWTSAGVALTLAHSREVADPKAMLEDEKTKLALMVAKAKSEKEALDRYNTQYYLHTTNFLRWETAVNEMRVKVAGLEERAELMEDAKKAIKSFMSCSFEEALQSIGDTASDLIRNIPNMANATITIEGTKETAKGAVKEEVNAVLNVDGEEAVPLRTLSGGERTSVDIAIDLAVIDLIQTKTNKGINVFVLDEPFTGLESINIEPILELLRQSNLGKKLFIVDHNPIIKESIQDRIMVVREGALSNLNN